ncbi:MAG: mechanosensitive ion channel family protein [Armatimonadota bacterium]|nr:MAG: mechanosensitive ion channel family protein [Armatimonadota bacterium]
MVDALRELAPWAKDALVASVVFCAFLLAMLAVRLLWLRILRPLVRRTDTELDDLVLVPVRGLIIWGLLLLGIYHSLNTLQAVQSNELASKWLGKALAVAWAVLAVITLLRLFNAIVSWYVQRAAEHAEHPRDISSQAGLARKIVNIAVLSIGILYVLQAAGVSISPLLAGGAIGGLAIALALQDTLANLFAGLYLNIDRPVAVGDFVKLESGEEGFVEEIGWRNTKVRLWANNVVVIPNQKLSQSVLTNYFLPKQEMSVYVWCGVAYDSDLQHVEDVTIEVAREVMQRVPGSALDWEPVVRWKEFGDFAITFVTVLRVHEFGSQYVLQSEFVKALHRRFKEEGIEIPFPIRTVIMKRPGAKAPAPAHAPSPDRVRAAQLGEGDLDEDEG